MSSRNRPSTFRIFPPSPPPQPNAQAAGFSDGLNSHPTLSGRAKETDFWKYQATSLLGGIRTPPEDSSMGTTYQAPTMAYENPHAHHSAYASTLPSSERTTSYPAYGQVDGQSVNSSQSSSSRSRHAASSTASGFSTIHYSTSRPSTQPTTPESTESRHELRVSTNDASLTTHSMIIPSCISPRGGSLSDFAAQVRIFTAASPCPNRVLT
jgi:hypothetical protein